MIRHIVSYSRFLFVIPAIGAFILSVGLFLYGAFLTVQATVLWFGSLSLSASSGKAFIATSIQIVDIFLVATVVYLISLGLYSLFVDDQLPLPAWLEIHDLDDLKSKLVAVVIVVLGVLFLGQAVTATGETSLLNLGAAVALVIAALTYYLSLKGSEKELHSESDHTRMGENDNAKKE